MKIMDQYYYRSDYRYITTDNLPPELLVPNSRKRSSLRVRSEESIAAINLLKLLRTRYKLITFCL